MRRRLSAKGVVRDETDRRRKGLDQLPFVFHPAIYLVAHVGVQPEKGRSSGQLAEAHNIIRSLPTLYLFVELLSP